jgi:hypothetical protein
MADKEPGRTGGLDETRRLLYMALLRSRTEKYELAGTLVNALVHHHPDRSDPDWSQEAITDRVVNVIEGADAPDGLGPQTGSREWVARQIQRLTEELGGGVS